MHAKTVLMHNAALALAIVVIALLGCKKKTDDTATSASATPPPPPPVSATAETTASAEPEASATPTATATTTIKVVTRTDAGVKETPDAGSTVSTADLKSIQACCAAIANESKKPGNFQNKYKSAAGVCNGIADQVKSGKANAAAARTQVRALIAGAPVPGGC